MAILANTTPFDLRAIMLKAWRDYRFQARVNRLTKFARGLFASLLRKQWEFARQDNAAQVEASIEEARLAVAIPRVRRIAEIRNELVAMEMSDRINWAAHRALSVELFQAVA